MRKPPSHEASSQSDQDLARRARAGSDAAFAVLVIRHRNEIYRLALRRLGNRSDAEDIVQETFLRAWRAISSFDGRAQIRTWLYRIAINVARTHWRASNWPPTESLHALLPRFEDSGWSETTDSVWTDRADDVVEQKQFAQQVQEAFRLLDESYRAVFVRRDLEGGSTEEVANALGISPANVRQRLSRARRKLRRRLKRFNQAA
jgi:RNA polymerase sigma-70 factor (ECF subfamily)